MAVKPVPTIKIKVVRSFVYDKKPVPVGRIFDMNIYLAKELRAAKKIEYVAPAAPLPQSAPAPPAAAAAQGGKKPEQKEARNVT